MARKKREPFVDDGRTLANMNVPGMPWHLDGPKVSLGKKNEVKEESLADMNLTKGERRAILKGVLMAILPIGMIFVIAYLLIFLFIHFVWLS